MKILLLLSLLFLNGQFIIADETNNLDEESCGVLYSTSIRVKQCKLYPDTDKLLKCGVVLRKLAKQQYYKGKGAEYLDNAFKVEAKAQKAWDRGGKIMIEREPITKKDRCGYYLDCLTSYVETLPMFAPDGRPLKHEQFETWQQYDKILLECANGAYTITTGIKKVEEKSPNFKKWRGEGAPFSRITVRKSKQVIFINPKGGEIINVPLPDSATSDRTSQKYIFDSHQCLFLKEEVSERDKHINIAPVYVFSTDGKGRCQRDMKFTNKTDLNFKISNIKPIIQINWSDIEKFDPTFHKASTYISKNIILNEQVFDVPKELKAVMTEANMVAARTLLNPFKAIDSKELCDIQMVVEFLHGHIIGRQAEKIAYDYDIDFRPANKSEIAKANKIIRRMKNWSGSRTEEKEIYDSLNHPFHTPKVACYEGEKRESYYGSEEEPEGILDVIIDKDIKTDDEPSWVEKDLANEIMEDEKDLLREMELEMFTNDKN